MKASEVPAIVFAAMPDFLSQVAECSATGCWFWEGRTVNGYGYLYHAGENWTTHRLAWTVANGKIRKGALLRHRCDHRACVNPHHMLLGNTRANSDDMMNGLRQTGAPMQPNGHLWPRHENRTPKALANIASTAHKMDMGDAWNGGIL